ncbi:hypothetical protein PR048_017162 [Dryococelus australis]|uniref:Uncharacterized protein n=1 Tax=Dryococelus australis TaxID=614101 RepID=A0ABQ9H8S6_9NEOP|nr:hypothetical protein PR048_017162 [Dryococelus australis]
MGQARWFNVSDAKVSVIQNTTAMKTSDTFIVGTLTCSSNMTDQKRQNPCAASAKQENTRQNTKTVPKECNTSKHIPANYGKNPQQKHHNPNHIILFHNNLSLQGKPTPMPFLVSRTNLLDLAKSQNKFHIPGYTCHRSDKEAAPCGGVSPLVKDGIPHYCKSIPLLAGSEAVVVRFTSFHPAFTSAICYISPCGPISTLSFSLSFSLSLFNIRHISTTQTCQLGLPHYHVLWQRPFKFRPFYQSCSTCTFFSNILFPMKELSSFCLGHLPYLSKYSTFSNLHHHTFGFRSFTITCTPDDLYAAVLKFTQSLLNLADKHIPKHQPPKADNPFPQQLRTLIRYKVRARGQWQCTCTADDLDHLSFTMQPSQMGNLIMEAQQQAIKLQSFLLTNGTTWQFIRKFRSKPKIIPSIVHAGSTIGSPYNKVQLLATDFSSTFHSNLHPSGYPGSDLANLSFTLDPNNLSMVAYLLLHVKFLPQYKESDIQFP